MTPYTKISDEETRRRFKQNIANGEGEKGLETLETEEEGPLLFQHESAEDYQQHVLKQKMHALEMYTIKTPEATDKVIHAEEFRFQQKEQELSAENTDSQTETKVEKSVLFIGNVDKIDNFNQAKVESTAKESIKEEPKTVAEQAPSSLSEFMADVQPMKWGKKGIGAVFGLVKGLFGGLFGTVKEATKVEHKKTEAEQKAEAKKAKQNAEKSAFYSRIDKAVAEARGAAQNTVGKVLVRLGIAGMGGDAMNSMLGSNRNLNSEEMNVYTAFEVAKKAEEAKKSQEKQVNDMQMAESQGPAVNIDAAVEGGTGGGKANLSAVSAGG